MILRWLPWSSELRRRNEVEFKSKGNRKQFEHQQQVRNCLANAKYEKAKRAIEEGITLTEKRIKVIKLADRSEFGWSTVSEYLSDELASNSEDEKRIFRSERRAERRSKQAIRRPKISARGRPGMRSSSNSAHSSPARSASTNGLLLRNPASRIGPCYKISIHSHLLSFYFCSLVFPLLCLLTFLLCLLLLVLVTAAHCILLTYSQELIETLFISRLTNSKPLLSGLVL